MCIGFLSQQKKKQQIHRRPINECDHSGRLLELVLPAATDRLAGMVDTSEAEANQWLYRFNCC